MTRLAIRQALLGLTFCALLLVLAAQASTAPLTPQAAAASDVNGYTASGMRYDLFSDDLTKVARVSFALAPASARDVRVRLDSSPGDWHQCVKRLDRFVCELATPLDLTLITRFDVLARG